MSAFKDFVAQDVNGLFLNLDEFAEQHNINGKVVKCIIDTDVNAGAKVTLEGVFINTKTVYVASDDIDMPVEGELFKIDGSMHFVRSVSDEDGIYAVTVSENNQ